MRKLYIFTISIFMVLLWSIVSIGGPIDNMRGSSNDIKGDKTKLPDRKRNNELNFEIIRCPERVDVAASRLPDGWRPYLNKVYVLDRVSMHDVPGTGFLRLLCLYKFQGIEGTSIEQIPHRAPGSCTIREDNKSFQCQRR